MNLHYSIRTCCASFFRIVLLSGLLSTLLAITVQAQTTRYVSTTGTNTTPASATSWATSTTNLQGAINASASGDMVWVAAGVYKPTDNPTQRYRSFAMANGVAIYGGFAGIETALTSRTLTYPSSTTLSGDIDNDGTVAGNSFFIFYNRGSLTETAILDGFIITGNATDSESGTAMYNDHCSPLIRNCTFRQNNGNAGGAMYNDGGFSESPDATASNPTLINCAFESNTATNGGGAIYNNGAFLGASPTLINCSFQNNVSENYGGGAIYTDLGESTGSISLINCAFWNNGGNETLYNSFIATTNAIYCLFDDTVTGYVSDPSNLTVTTSPFASSLTTQLRAASPAIDAGSNTDYTNANGPATDLGGNDRFYNAGTIDIGAFEYAGQTCPVVVIFGQPAAGSAVCAGTNITAPVSFSGNVTNLQWYKDGVPVTGQTTETLSLTAVTATDAGNYSLVLTTTCSSLTSSVFSLTVNPVPTATILGNLSICAGSSTILTASGADSYIWSSGQNTSAISVSVANTYSVTATTSAGCSATASAVVTVNSGPTDLTLTSGTLTCANTSLTLTGTATNGSSFSLSNGQTNTTGLFVVSLPGTYSLSVRNAAGCVSVSVATATVSSDITKPALTLSPASATLSCGNSVTLTASVLESGVFSYTFLPGGIVSSSLVVSAAGTYSVVVSGANGCTALASTSVTTLPTTAITAQPAAGSGICGGGLVTVSVSTSGAVSGYQWYRNGLILSAQVTAVLTISAVTATDAGNYVVVVTGGCSSLTSTVFSLTVNPATNFITQPPAQKIVCITGPATIPVAVAGAGPFTYQWYKNTTATPVSGQTSATLTLTNLQPLDASAYFCVVTGGCSAVRSTAVSLVFDVIYVTTTGAGAKDGTSWANAYAGPQLQAAIEQAAAQTTCPTRMVWIGAGLYKPTTTTGPDSRFISYALRNNVWVYGGFVGNEIYLGQRPPISITTPATTTLSGDIGTPNDASDNTYHVFYNKNVDESALLDGAVITGGNANRYVGDDIFGGGVYNNGRFGQFASPRFAHCWITGNQAGLGGGMGNNGYKGTASPQLIACWFTNNTALRYGGGFYSDGDNGGESLPQLRSCTFWQNRAPRGPALITVGGTGKCEVLIINTTIIGNPLLPSITANPAPGPDNARTTLINCIVRGNGDAVFCTAGDEFQPPTILYSNIDFANAGTTNVNLNPQFLNAVAGDFRLPSTSPMINAGNPTSSTTGSGSANVGAEDGYGQDRIVGGRVDMGSFEFAGICTSDAIASVKDGLWNDPATWSCGRVPALGERVLLNHAVTIPANYTGFGKALVYGAGGRLIYSVANSVLHLE
jgi:predicted outer membrane repeat protein